MSDRFQRRQMVRLEKEQEEPLTIQDLDNANNGDEKAQKKIIDEAKSQQDEDQKRQQKLQNSRSLKRTQMRTKNKQMKLDVRCMVKNLTSLQKRQKEKLKKQLLPVMQQIN